MKKKRINKEVLLIFLLLIFFLLGFSIATIIFSSYNSEIPILVVNTDTSKIIPIVNRNYFDIVYNELKNASSEVDIAMFEFKFYENEENKVRKITDLLVNLSLSGVKVRVLLDQSNWNPSIRKNNEPLINYLRNNGIRAKFDSPKKTLHAKLIIIDNDSVILGSTNLGFYALERNNEANVLIKNREIANYFKNYFENLWNS